MEQGLGFGPFALYPLQKLLLEDGAPVDLGSRALDILVLLARHRGEVVSKETLIAKTWPDVFVDEVSLRVHVSALRRALGDGVGGRRFIKTTPGRGYSFVAPVAVLGDIAANASRPATSRLSPERRIVGRDDLIASLEADLGSERLVTLTGPAGIGKTTVAVEVARRVSNSYADGSALVDLAPLTDARAIPMTLEMAVGLSNLGAPTLEKIAAALSGRRVLLIFDNCEHLVESVAKTVEFIVAGTQGVQIISTSREPLGVRGEKLRRVEPLSLPEAGVSHTVAGIRAYPAVELFEQRARAVLDGFEIDDANADFVASICRRLDGVPFAIELAASRVDAFGLSDISAQLDARMGLLDASALRTAPRHQRSLRDALTWSYDLLTEEERALLRHLSVFAGAFSLADANDLIGAGRRRDTVQAIGGLASKSLLSVDVRGLEASYRLLEMTRLFAAERLAEEDDNGLWRQRHADLVKTRLQTLTVEATPAGVPGPPASARYIDDLSVALDWASGDPREADRAVALTLAAVPLWTHLSLHQECRRRTEQALGLKRETPERGAQDVALRTALGTATMFSEGHGPESVATLSEALDAARRLGDVEHELRAIWGLFSCATNTGDFPQSLKLAEEFADAARSSPLQDDRLVAERMLGVPYYFMGYPAQARVHLEAFLGQYIPPPDGRDIRRYHLEQRIQAQIHLAATLWHLGLPEQARALSDRYLGEATSLDHPLTLVYATAHHAFQSTILYRDVEVARADLRRLGEHAKRTPAASQYLAILSATLEAGLGDASLGVERLEAAVKQQAATGLAPGFLNALGYLAMGWARLGDTERALVAVESGLRRSEQRGEMWCHAELTRIKGDILLEAGEPEKATALLEAAVREAQERGALGWELRAATDLARLWSDRGRKQDASELLRGTCSKFSEGFETTDLKAAARLLQSLA